MNLTVKQMETLIALVETMETNFDLDADFELAAEDDFFNWANEENIRGAFAGKTVSGRMSSLMKKGILQKDYAYETKWVKVRRCLTLKEIAYPLWTFSSKEMFGKALGIKKGESPRDALNRMKAIVEAA